ncbi:hypothetical protein QTP88_015312 [Uroleucon formosanum]
MAGATAGAIAKIKEKSNETTSSHCILHRHALAMKNIPLCLKNVLDEAIKIVNFIKSRPLKSRLFKILCDDLGSIHNTLLFHTEIRWLSRGKVLTRLMELRAEVSSFLMDHNVTLAETMNDVTWLCQLSYLADIFNKMNELSLSLQGRTLTIFDSSSRVCALKRKIDYCLSSIEYESLIDITSDSTFQSTFSSNSYVEFWLNFKNTSFDNLSQKAITILLPFATTYLCETGFSAYAATKTKYRNRLNVEPDLRIQLSKIEPDIAKLSKNKQPQKSH